MSEPPFDDRTRRMAPATPPPPPGTPREYVLAEGDPAIARAALLEELRALKRWLAVLGVVAVAALGTALYTLLSEEEDGDGRGASRTSVRALDDRVEELEARIDDRATKTSVAKVREEQQELSGQVEELSKQAGEGVDAKAVDEVTEGLRAEVDDLEQRVEAAEQAAQTGGTDGGSP